MKRVILTGGTGFIGRHAIEFLEAKDFEVHIPLLGGPPEGTWGNAKFHPCDLLDSAQRNRFFKDVRASHLLHFAWYVEHGDFWASPQNETWLQASIEILQRFREAGGVRAVLAGTCAEYDWKAGAAHLSEDRSPLAPATVYGDCKHRLQLELARFAALSGMSGAWGRIFFLYGPYENPKRLVSSTIRNLLLGDLVVCRNPGLIRDFTHVRDVASAFAHLLDHEYEGPLNISSGHPTSLEDVIRKIAELMEISSSFLSFGPPPSVAGSISVDPVILTADVSRLNALGWQPEFDLKSGLKDSIEWWKTRIGSRN